MFFSMRRHPHTSLRESACLLRQSVKPAGTWHRIFYCDRLAARSRLNQANAQLDSLSPSGTSDWPCVREGRILPVPVHLRDSHYQGAKQFGHGEGYQYAHDSADAIAAQDYLGIEREYYRPVDRGFECELAQRLETIRAKLRSGRAQDS